MVPVALGLLRTSCPVSGPPQAFASFDPLRKLMPSEISGLSVASGPFGLKELLAPACCAAAQMQAHLSPLPFSEEDD